jgi:hypothetical protein
VPTETPALRAKQQSAAQLTGLPELVRGGRAGQRFALAITTRTRKPGRGQGVPLGRSATA